MFDLVVGLQGKLDVGIVVVDYQGMWIIVVGGCFEFDDFVVYWVEVVNCVVIVVGGLYDILLVDQ